MEWTMKWSYKTVHFELKKEGLLGGAFLDETEIEEQLNQFGQSGWELISVIEVQNGIICFFRQPLTSAVAPYADRVAEAEAETDQYEAYVDEDDRLQPYREDELQKPEEFEEDDTAEELSGAEEPVNDEYDVYEETDYATEDAYESEPYDDETESVEALDEVDETDDDPVVNRVGAIRIE